MDDRYGSDVLASGWRNRGAKPVPTVAAEQGLIGLAAYLALLVLAFRRLLRGAWRAPARAAIAAGFAALVLHTWLYAAFLEDPVTWTLLAVGTAPGVFIVSQVGGSSSGSIRAAGRPVS